MGAASWWGWLGTALCLVVAGHCVARLSAIRSAVRTCDTPSVHVAHLVMALGTAAMVCPLGDPVPSLVWVVWFTAAAAWFALTAGRGDPDRDPGYYQRRNRSLQQVLANAAMVYMAVMAAVPGRAMAGTLAMTLGTGLGIYLLLYGGWMALRLAGAVWLVGPGFDASPVSGALRLVYAPRVIAGCDVAISLIMGALLIHMPG